jgi:phage terminase large subunit-like protein
VPVLLKNSLNDGVTLEAWPPRWLTPVPPEDLERGDGPLFLDFGEAVCRIDKDSLGGSAGSLIRFRPPQRHLVRHILARGLDGRYRHRQALVGMARKNGKSGIGSVLGVGGLVLGPAGGEVYSCAADKDQAKIVFNTAKRMVKADPELSGLLKVYRDAIEYTETGSVYKALSAEAFTKEGLNPHLVLFDEVHAQPNRELWDVMALAMGARTEPLMVGITTAGVKYDTSGAESLCYAMYLYGIQVAKGEVVDPTFFMAWWEPRDPSADHRDPDTWREANPGLGDLVDVADLASAVLRTPENEFRTKRCNQWVSSTTAWLPAGTWEACEEPRTIPRGREVVLGFDGSFNGDCTALVVVEIGSPLHVDVVELWEKPMDSPGDWRVPIADVEDAIRAACKRWQVVELACDPFRWARTYQILEAEGLPVVEFPQSPSRMTPATTRFYEAVMNRTLTQSGDLRLARHLDNAVLKADSRGTRIYKEHKHSQRRIDLAVAAVMAVDRAGWLAGEPPKRPAPAPMVTLTPGNFRSETGDLSRLGF